MIRKAFYTIYKNIFLSDFTQILLIFFFRFFFRFIFFDFSEKISSQNIYCNTLHTTGILTLFKSQGRVQNGIYNTIPYIVHDNCNSTIYVWKACQRGTLRIL